MRIDRAKTGADGVVQVDSGGSLFFFRSDDALSSGFILPPAPCELGETDAGRLRELDERFRAERAATALCARAEQCASRLETKLRSRGFSGSSAALAVRRAVELSLVDDARYARAWLACRLPRSSDSPAALELALRARGVEETVARKAVAELVDEEVEAVLLARAREKARAKGHEGTELRRYLRSKGFSARALSADS